MCKTMEDAWVTIVDASDEEAPARKTERFDEAPIIDAVRRDEELERAQRNAEQSLARVEQALQDAHANVKDAFVKTSLDEAESGAGAEIKEKQNAQLVKTTKAKTQAERALALARDLEHRAPLRNLASKLRAFARVLEESRSAVRAKQRELPLALSRATHNAELQVRQWAAETQRAIEATQKRMQEAARRISASATPQATLAPQLRASLAARALGEEMASDLRRLSREDEDPVAGSVADACARFTSCFDTRDADGISRESECVRLAFDDFLQGSSSVAPARTIPPDMLRRIKQEDLRRQLEQMSAGEAARLYANLQARIADAPEESLDRLRLLRDIVLIRAQDDPTASSSSARVRRKWALRAGEVARTFNASQNEIARLARDAFDRTRPARSALEQARQASRKTIQSILKDADALLQRHQFVWRESVLGDLGKALAGFRRCARAVGRASVDTRDAIAVVRSRLGLPLESEDDDNDGNDDGDDGDDDGHGFDQSVADARRIRSSSSSSSSKNTITLLRRSTEVARDGLIAFCSDLIMMSEHDTEGIIGRVREQSRSIAQRARRVRMSAADST